jgi:hypothetical protein
MMYRMVATAFRECRLEEEPSVSSVVQAFAHLRIDIPTDQVVISRHTYEPFCDDLSGLLLYRRTDPLRESAAVAR